MRDTLSYTDKEELLEDLNDVLSRLNRAGMIQDVLYGPGVHKVVDTLGQDLYRFTIQPEGRRRNRWLGA